MTDKKQMTVDDLFEAIVNLSIDDLGAGRVLIENYRESQREQAVEEYKQELFKLDFSGKIEPDTTSLWLTKINREPEFVKQYKKAAIRLAKIMECYLVNDKMMGLEPDVILKYIGTILYWGIDQIPLPKKEQG